MSSDDQGNPPVPESDDDANTWEGPGSPAGPDRPWDQPTAHGAGWPGSAGPGFAESGPPTTPYTPGPGGSGAIPMPPVSPEPPAPGVPDLPAAPGGPPAVEPPSWARAADAPTWRPDAQVGGQAPWTPPGPGAWTPPPGPPGSVPPPGSYPGFGPGYGGNWGHPAPPWTPAPSSHRGRGLAAAIIVVAVIVAAVLGGVVGHAVWQPSSATNSSVVFPPSTGNGSGSGSSTPSGGPSGSTAAAVAKEVDPGLVDVNTVIDYGQAEGAGTGMVLTSNGEVLTNNHVVEGATSISVTDVGNGQTYKASVVGYDRSQDVAIIQLANASGLQTVSTGDSSKVTTGDSVVAIGNAGGTGGTPSYAGGSITATDQSVTASDELTGTSEQLTGMLETNADIVAGDSGGPLVTTSGQVIGMDTAGSSGFQFQSSGNEGFAIPINTALSVAKQIEAGTASSTIHVGPTAFLGVQVEPAGSCPTGSGTGFGGFGGLGGLGNGSGSSSSSSGAEICGTVSNSPAASGGLTEGDVITSLGGHSVTSDNALTDILVNDESPGQSVQVGYTNTSGQQSTVTITLASGPAQ